MSVSTVFTALEGRYRPPLLATDGTHNIMLNSIPSLMVSDPDPAKWKDEEFIVGDPYTNP